MRKGKDIVGKPVIAYDSGEKVETIVNLIFDQNDNQSGKRSRRRLAIYRGVVPKRSTTSGSKVPWVAQPTA
jgi:hypothetical protein